MVQDILTYTLVIWAFAKTAQGLFQMFQSRHGHSCSTGSCGNCSAKSDLFKEIKKGKYPTLIKD